MTLNAQKENEKTIVKTQKMHIKHKKENRNRHEEGKGTLTRTVLSFYIDGVHQSSLRMYRDHIQRQQFPSHSPPPLPFWILKMVGKCIWRIVVFTACVCVGVACSFCLAFGFWGQFSSVSSHHFVWIVFTVAVEFRGMQIDFGSRSQRGSRATF